MIQSPPTYKTDWYLNLMIKNGHQKLKLSQKKKEKKLQPWC